MKYLTISIEIKATTDASNNVLICGVAGGSSFTVEGAFTEVGPLPWTSTCGNRLRMLVAGMARYTSQKFAKKYRKPLLLSEESYDEEEFSNELLPLIYKLFDDAGVEYSRINYHGEAYCVAEEAAFQYICWYNLPWE